VTARDGTPSAEVPVAFAEVLDGWSPPPEVVEGVLGPWPATALAALLGASPVSAGEALPPLWQEVYLHTAHPVSALADDGHPLSDSLVPPLADRRRMFGGGRFHVEEPLLVGDAATRTSTVANVRAREGRSGWLLLVTERHDFTVGGSLRVREERDIVYRLAFDVGRPGRPPEAVVPGPVAYTIEPDERFLFCFSALTYNAHRIHYDRDFTVGVEGHPDLLVHGPLLAIGTVEAASRYDPREIAAVDYRLVSPAYVGGGTVGFSVTPDDDHSLWVLGHQGAVPKIETVISLR
jgi:hydroxyacyl-ACP dehydratase HTD2-like protein with hotdog domain